MLLRVTLVTYTVRSHKLAVLKNMPGGEIKPWFSLQRNACIGQEVNMTIDTIRNTK